MQSIRCGTVAGLRRCMRPSGRPKFSATVPRRCLVTAGVLSEADAMMKVMDSGQGSLSELRGQLSTCHQRVFVRAAAEKSGKGWAMRHLDAILGPPAVPRAGRNEPGNTQT